LELYKEPEIGRGELEINFNFFPEKFHVNAHFCVSEISPTHRSKLKPVLPPTKDLI
jgi:hypothetical protein